MKIIFIVLIVFILAGFGAFYLLNCSQSWCLNYEKTGDGIPNDGNNNGKDLHPLIHVSSPSYNALIGSPLTITGEARGNWYFEASFPVKLYDGNGKLIALKPAQAKGEWMTTDFVPFEVVLTFNTPSTTPGTLVLEKDNPSGLKEHEDSLP